MGETGHCGKEEGQWKGMTGRMTVATEGPSSPLGFRSFPSAEVPQGCWFIVLDLQCQSRCGISSFFLHRANTFDKIQPRYPPPGMLLTVIAFDGLPQHTTNVTPHADSEPANTFSAPVCGEHPFSLEGGAGGGPVPGCLSLVVSSHLRASQCCKCYSLFRGG